MRRRPSFSVIGPPSPVPQFVHFPQAPGARSARLATRIRARRGRAVRTCGPGRRRGKVDGGGFNSRSDSPDNGSGHRVGRPRQDRAMESERERGTAAAVWIDGRSSAEGLLSAARPTESHLSHLIPLNPAESRPRNGFHAIPPPPVPLPTGSFPSTAGASSARLPTRHSARGAVAPSGPDGPGRRRGDADCTRPCFLAPAEVRRGDRAANARRSFFASGGRRGDADGRSLLSLSAPGGGEGRGEVGALASVLRSGEDAPCPAAEAR